MFLLLAVSRKWNFAHSFT